MKIIGIAGGTGSGKSTLARNLHQRIGAERAAIITHDSYYRDQSELSMDERLEVNYDHPESLETELLVSQLQSLKSGKAVEIPEYNFSRFTRAETSRHLASYNFILVEGILLLSDQDLVSMFDLKVFVDVPADIRLMRRLKRDVEERGRTYEYGINQYRDFSRPMHQQFVEPSKAHADIVITEGGENQEGLKRIIDAIGGLDERRKSEW